MSLSDKITVELSKNEVLWILESVVDLMFSSKTKDWEFDILEDIEKKLHKKLNKS